MRIPGVLCRWGALGAGVLLLAAPGAEARERGAGAGDRGVVAIERGTGAGERDAAALQRGSATATWPAGAASTRAAPHADTLAAPSAALRAPVTPDGFDASDAPLLVGPEASGGSAWTHVARGAAALGTLLVADAVVREVTHATQGDAGEAIASRAKWLGTWKRSAPVYLGGAALLGAALDGERGLRAAGAVVVGTLAGAGANEVVNVGLGRHRPGAERGAFAFSPLRGHASLPSGHAAYTFALAGAIDEATEGTLPAVLAYTAAGLCSLSRIYHDRHWVSDVTIGAFIGATVSRRATRAALHRFGVRRGAAVGEPGAYGAAAGAADPSAERPARVELLPGPALWGFRVRF